MTKTDVNSRLQHLFHPRDTPPLRVSIKTALQVNIHQRIRDKVDTGHFQQPEQTRSISTIVRVHRCGMTGGHFRAHIQLQRQRGYGFDKTRLFVVNLIAMHIHQPVVFLRQRKSFM
ncbi:hypothetical protein D3C73_1415200 [compost metagenome]